MKTRFHAFRWVPIAMIAVVALLQRNAADRNDRAALRVSAGTGARTDGKFVPAPTRRATRQAPTPALRAAIRSKFAQWRETEADDAETRERLTVELTALLTDQNAAGIVRSLTSDERGSPFGFAAFARWLEVDDAAAAGWIAAQTDATETEALLVARRWLREPERMLERADELPDVEWKQTLLLSAGLEGLADDPAAAVRIAERLNPGADQVNLLQTIAYGWMSRDPGAASKWIMQLEDPELRESLLAVGAKAIAASDPDLAAGWLVTAVKSNGVLTETALCIVEAWVARDPVKAAAWAAQFPTQGGREAAVETVAREWTKAEPDAAIAWIRKLPEGEAVLARLRAAEAAGEGDVD